MIRIASITYSTPNPERPSIINKMNPLQNLKPKRIANNPFARSFQASKEAFKDNLYSRHFSQKSYCQRTCGLRFRQFQYSASKGIMTSSLNIVKYLLEESIQDESLSKELQDLRIPEDYVQISKMIDSALDPVLVTCSYMGEKFTILKAVN